MNHQQQQQIADRNAMWVATIVDFREQLLACLIVLADMCPEHLETVRKMHETVRAAGGRGVNVDDLWARLVAVKRSILSIIEPRPDGEELRLVRDCVERFHDTFDVQVHSHLTVAVCHVLGQPLDAVELHGMLESIHRGPRNENTDS